MQRNYIKFKSKSKQMCYSITLLKHKKNPKEFALLHATFCPLKLLLVSHLYFMYLYKTV